MTSILRSYVALALALSVALSSVGHATARHQAHGATTLVICTAYGLMRITMDANGNPVEQTLPCPDCVIKLAALLPEGHSGLHENAHRRADLPAPRALWFSAAAGFWHDTRAPPTLV